MQKIYCFFLFIFFIAFTPLQGQSVFSHSDALADDEFGYTVSVHGEFAAVAAQRSDAEGQQSGAVYLFKFDGENWQETQKITAPDGTAWDYFGTGLELTNDYLVIGCYFDDDNGMNSGSAFLYKRDGDNWTYQTKVSASGGAAHDWLGNQVDLTDEFMVAGANGAGGGIGEKYGAAYVYKNNFDGTWSEIQKLIKDAPNPADEFGYDVAIQGDYIFVGAPRQDNTGGNRGMVYIYKNNGTDNFELVQTLENENGTDTDQFGLRLDADANRLIVLSQSSAFVYQLDGGSWLFDAALTPPANGVNFVDVRIYNDYALVNNYISGLQGTPNVHLYHRADDTWDLVETFSPTSGNSGQRFSHSFDLHSGKILVGAPRNSTQGATAGAAFAYSFEDLTDLSSGLNMISINKGIKVFPNPATNFINLTLNNEINGNLDFKIFDTLGRLVKAGSQDVNGDNLSINISDLIADQNYFILLPKERLMGSFVK